MTVADVHPDDTDTVLPASKPITLTPRSPYPRFQMMKSTPLLDHQLTLMLNTRHLPMLTTAKTAVKVPAAKMIEIIPARTTKLKASPQILVSISQTKNYLTGNFTNFEKVPTHSLITTSCIDETSKDTKLKATPQILVSISQTKKYLTGNFTNFEKFPPHSLITTPRVDETSKMTKLRATPQILVSISQTKKHLTGNLHVLKNFLNAH
jgi:hypothetical protein